MLNSRETYSSIVLLYESLDFFSNGYCHCEHSKEISIYTTISSSDYNEIKWN